MAKRPTLANVPRPRRRGELGSLQSLLDDLVLARDAGGLEHCGADRLQGTLYLKFGGQTWTLAEVAEARETLRGHVERGCSAYEAVNRGDACAMAAATSLRTILLRETSDRRPLNTIRRQAREAHRCAIADDSLRKREQPILELIAEQAYAALAEANDDLMPNREAVVQLLRPYAELAALNVADAAKKFSQRAALHDDRIFYRAIAHAVWAIAQFGVLPLYGLQRLEAMGRGDVTDAALGYLLEGIISVPFREQPDDLNQLATAIQLGEDPEPFYDRLVVTPVMRPVVQRLVNWLGSHDPKVCLYDSNDVMVGYCGPHYYVALCESWADAAENLASGEFSRDMEAMLRAMPFAERARRQPDASAE